MNNKLLPRLRNQFIFSKNKHLIPSDWNQLELNGWVLGIHKSLPSAKISDEKGKYNGILLGFIFTSEGKTLASEYICKSENNDIDSFVEDNIYKNINGRFAFIVYNEDSFRFYIDPLGSLSALFDKDQEAIVSSPLLLGKDKQSKDWDENLFSISNQLFFEKTFFKNVKRIIPNYYLDILTWKTKRHFPVDIMHSQISISEKKISNISEDLEKWFKSFGGKEKLYFSLTAGSDARMLLAVCKKYKEKITFINVSLSNNKIDEKIPDMIADRLSLKQLKLGSKEASDEEKELFLKILGFNKILFRIIPEVEKELNDTLIITGVNGEIGRGAYYRHIPDINGKTIGELFEILGVDKNMYKDEIQRMKEELPTYITNHQILDLIFIEQIGGCISGPNTYVFDSLGFNLIHAFNGRNLICDMLKLPIDYKKNQELVSDLCELNWKELSNIPINSL